MKKQERAVGSYRDARAYFRAGRSPFLLRWKQCLFETSLADTVFLICHQCIAREGRDENDRILCCLWIFIERGLEKQAHIC